MNNLPPWIPSIRSWFNAIALVLLMMGLYRVLIYLLLLLIPGFPWLVNFFALFALVSPIIAIAFLHQGLHKFLDSTFPDSKISTEELRGIFPGLFSWWQGLYGWMVNALSAYIVLYATKVFLPTIALLNLTFYPSSIRSNFAVSIWIILFQIVVAAYLYQIEFLVQKRLIAEGETRD